MIRLLSHLRPNDWTERTMTRVYLIRPGATSYDRENRITGTLDLPLCEEGVRQIGRLKTELTDVHMAALYHSPSLAALRTAESLGPVLRLRPKCESDLRNVDMGLWQGLTWAELRERHPKVWKQRAEDPRAVEAPMGESFDEAYRRIDRFLESLLKRYRDESVGIIASDPVAQIISARLRGDTKIRLTDSGMVGTMETLDVESDSPWRRSSAPDSSPKTRI
ncbi:histidine phosphatase family protein [bacterium]|nr:histidine phosphatase family protein [bacterium]